MGIIRPIISSSELHSDMIYPLVPRDILGYYSTHYHFIRTSFRYELPSGTERYSWVSTPPIIISSEFYSDMNYPLVLSDILHKFLFELIYGRGICAIQIPVGVRTFHVMCCTGDQVRFNILAIHSRMFLSLIHYMHHTDSCRS